MFKCRVSILTKAIERHKAQKNSLSHVLDFTPHDFKHTVVAEMKAEDNCIRRIEKLMNKRFEW